MEIRTRTNDTYHVYEAYDNDLTTVEVTHLPTGAVGRGHARRHPDDPYVRNVGKQLAYFRALERLSNKIVRGISKVVEEGFTLA